MSPEVKTALKESIRSDYPEHGPIPIAGRFGIAKGTVSRMAFEMGVRCLTNHARRVATVMATDRGTATTYFDSWNNRMAWLVGYIWADGAIDTNRVQFRCHQADRALMTYIRDELCPHVKLIEFPPKKLQGKPYVGGAQIGFRVNSKRITDRLAEIGIHRNKSNTNPAFPNVPDEFLAPFVRGVIDGDGSICLARPGRWQVIVYGTERFIESLAPRIVNAAGLTSARIQSVGSSAKLRRVAIARDADVLRVLNWLYADPEPCLRRKQEMATLAIAEILSRLQSA